MYYMCIICVFAGFIWLFLGFWCPRRFLYVLLLAFAGFSWVFGVRGDFCMCFCWLLLGFLASAAIFVCRMLGFVKTPFKRKAKSFYRGRGGPPGGPQHHLNPRMGGQRGEPDNISQPVDPGGVGGFEGLRPTRRPKKYIISNHKIDLKCVFNDSEMLFNDFEMFCLWF